MDEEPIILPPDVDEMDVAHAAAEDDLVWQSEEEERKKNQ